MDTRTKQLIGIGAAVTANCIPCIQGLVRKARLEGVADTEIRAAIGVGRTVRTGAQMKWDAAAAELVGTEAQPESDLPDGRCPLTGEVVAAC